MQMVKTTIADYTVERVFLGQQSSENAVQKILNIYINSMINDVRNPYRN